MRWIDLTPRDFRNMVRDTGVCVVPVGSLERHGEHIPFGCDGVVADTLVNMAAELEPCVVFPTWYWGQVHEAACFDGTINFPPEMLLSMLRQLLQQIAKNGFRKIVLCSGHGGNSDMLRFFDMATLDEKRDYSLYIVDLGNAALLEEEERAQMNALLDTPVGGHADERETSFLMASRPGNVKLEYIDHAEPIIPGERMAHLPGIHSALWWYAKFPQHVTGTPSAATQEKGQALLQIKAKALARAIARIKADQAVPQMQQEFYRRMDAVGKTE